MPGAALKRAGIAGVDTRAGDYPSGRGQGAWTGSRRRRPGGRPWRAAGSAAAGPARVARPSGEGMPMAGRISASHRIRNIAINTGVLVSIRPAAQGFRWAARLLFRFGASKSCRWSASAGSVESLRPATLPRAMPVASTNPRDQWLKLPRKINHLQRQASETHYRGHKACADSPGSKCPGG